jgi:hypothetical protein
VIHGTASLMQPTNIHDISGFMDAGIFMTSMLLVSGLALPTLLARADVVWCPSPVSLPTANSQT